MYKPKHAAKGGKMPAKVAGEKAFGVMGKSAPRAPKGAAHKKAKTK